MNIIITHFTFIDIFSKIIDYKIEGYLINVSYFVKQMR